MNTFTRMLCRLGRHRWVGYKVTESLDSLVMHRYCSRCHTRDAMPFGTRKEWKP